jgi:hypothetical protein
MKIDRQKHAVDAWEKGWADWHRRTLTLPESRKLVRRACVRYGLKPPAVRAVHGESTRCIHPDVILLLPDHHNPASVLHETAHYVCDWIFGDDTEDHCAEWLGIYLVLLEEFKVAPPEALYASAHAQRLQWWPASAVSPAALRARARTSKRAGS